MGADLERFSIDDSSFSVIYYPWVYGSNGTRSWIQFLKVLVE